MLTIDKHNRVVPDPETLTIKAFKKIWDKDTSDNKIKALSIFGYIYHKYHPKSDYAKSAEGDELQQLLLNDIIGDLKWKPTLDVIEAEAIYSARMISSGKKALQSALKSLKIISEQLDTGLNLDAIEDPSKRISVMKDLLSLISAMPTATTELQKALNKLNDEQLGQIKKDKKSLSGFELPPDQR